jgi:hypothetical protein
MLCRTRYIRCNRWCYGQAGSSGKMASVIVFAYMNGICVAERKVRGNVAGEER